MSTVVWVTEWTLAVLAFWMLVSITAGLVWVAIVEYFTWRARHRAGVWGRGWSDL